MANELTAGWKPAHPAMARDMGPVRPAEATDPGPDPPGGRVSVEAAAVAAESAASAAAARASAAIAAAARLAAEAEAAAIAATRAADVLAATQERGPVPPRDSGPLAPARAAGPASDNWTPSPVGPVRTPVRQGAARPVPDGVVEGAAEVNLFDEPTIHGFDRDAVRTAAALFGRVHERARWPRTATREPWSADDAGPLAEPVPDPATVDDTTEELNRINIVGVESGPGVEPAPDPLDPAPPAGPAPTVWGRPVTEPRGAWSDPSIPAAAVESTEELAPARGARHRGPDDAGGVEEETVALHPPARETDEDIRATALTLAMRRPHLRLAPSRLPEPVDGPDSFGSPEGVRPVAAHRPGRLRVGALRQFDPDGGGPGLPDWPVDDDDLPDAVAAEARAGRLDDEPVEADGRGVASEPTAVDPAGIDRGDWAEPAPLPARQRRRPRGLLAVASAILLLGVAGLVTTLGSEPVPEPTVGPPTTAPPVAQPAPVPTPPPDSPLDAPLRAAADPESAQAAALLDALRRAGVPISRNGVPEIDAAEVLCRQMGHGADTGSLIRTLPAVLPTVTSAQAPVVVEVVSRHYC
jgi:hypothetical protein